MKHYKKVGFLLAAGASVDLGLPTSGKVMKAFDKLVADPVSQIPPEDQRLYRRIAELLRPEQPTDLTPEQLVGLTSKQSTDFERVFDLLNVGPGDTIVLGTPESRKRLYRTLRQHFVDMLFLDADTDNHFEKLGPLPSCLGYTLEVFTLNQDQGVEQGAGPFTHVETGCPIHGPDHPWSEVWFHTSEGRLIIFLHKVHGSTNWQRNSRGGFFSVDPARLLDAMKAALVLGHKAKIPENLPYTFKFHRHRFRTIGMDLVVVIGFSFRDGHIVDLLIDVLRNGTDILVVSPETPEFFEKFWERAAQVIKTGRSGSTPGNILVQRKSAHDFFMGLPWSLYRGIPADDNGA